MTRSGQIIGAFRNIFPTALPLATFQLMLEELDGSFCGVEIGFAE